MFNLFRKLRPIVAPIETPEPEDNETKFANFVAEMYVTPDIEDAIKSLEEKESKLKASIAEMFRDELGRRKMRKLGRKQAELMRVKSQLLDMRRLQLKGDQKIEWYRQQYREICAIPRVLAVALPFPRIELTTDVLFGLDRENRWHRIGPLKTSYSLRNPEKKTFAWENLEGPRDGFHAPPNIPVSIPHGICMGAEADKVLRDAASKHDHPAICKLLVRYPECCGQTDVIGYWPIVPEADVPRWYLETRFEPPAVL